MQIIICGANEICSMIATEFFEDYDVVIIDSNQDRLESFSKLDVETINADILDIEVLKKVDLRAGDVFIACSTDENSNIIACNTAKFVANCQTVCFVSKKDTRNTLRKMRHSLLKTDPLFIDNIIWAEKLLTQEMLQLITIPEAIEVENFAQGRARLLEYRIKENSILCNKLIKDCKFSEDVLIVGIVRDEELFIPTGMSELKLNDKIIFMGTPEGLDVTASSLFAAKDETKKVAIIGGGSVGFELAESLEKTSIKIKMIEQNYKRCEVLSENLKKTLVLHGDGTDLDLLSLECIGEYDVVVCVTDSDEKNLLCSLLAKQIGAKRIIARVARASTGFLFEKVGVDVAISAKAACVEEIKNRIIESKNQILATVERGLGEIIQINVDENFKDLSIMELKMPAKAIIAIIERQNKIIIPKGQTLIRGKDKLIIFTKAQDANAVREFFKV